MSRTREARPIRVARIDTTHGLRGEVSARLLTDFPERFAELEHVRVGAEGAARTIRLVSWRLHRGKVLLTLEGIDDVDAARGLVESDVWIEAEEAVDLPADTYWQHDLIGLTVRLPTGEELGTVRKILQTGAADVLQVEGGGRELLIPAVRRICVRVDLDAGELIVDPPEGLLEINAV